MNTSVKSPTIYLLALEPSGDMLGAKLMTALMEQTNNEVGFAGVGGAAMSEKGLETLFSTDELSILGIFEVIPKAGTVLKRVKEVLADIERVRPDILVTIDSWGFTGRVHKALAKQSSPIKRVRYVAPQVWAWRPGRAKQLAQWIDHLITLFPFEPPYFEKHGLSSTWAGHPVVEGSDHPASGERFRSKYGIGSDAPVISVLPGSRKSEVRTLTPTFGEVVSYLAKQVPDLNVVVPTVASVESYVRAWAKSLPVPTHIVLSEGDRRDALSASRAALAASGTITLELAIANVPHVIAYKVNPVSAFLFKRLAKTKYVNLINVLLNRPVVPELLQQDCQPDLLSDAMIGLMQDEARRQFQVLGFQEAISQLTPSGAAPSQAAAQVVLRLLREA